jgi:hypothetical protein
VAGYSLKTVIKRASGRMTRQKKNAQWELNSIYFYWEKPPREILAAGEPVYYRFDPPTIPPGGVAQVAVHLRYVPAMPTLALGVVTSDGTVAANIPIDANAPQLASIGYSPDLTRVYLHWRRFGGAAPKSVILDGTDVTANTKTVGDPSVNFGASVITLPKPLRYFSYHVYQGLFDDGKVAAASQRAWTNKFIYGAFSSFTFKGNYQGKDWIAEAADHGLNNDEVNLGDAGQYMATPAGQADAKAHEYGYTINTAGKLNALDPDMWFLTDEPDAQESVISSKARPSDLKLPPGGSHASGTLVLKMIEYGEQLRAKRPNVPTCVNLDGSLRPSSYSTWGQAVDILQFDNYYQRRLSDSYWFQPEHIPLYKKAYYIYASSRSGCAGAEPNPSNQLLYSNAQTSKRGEDLHWPFPTRECKRIEVYYALAGGSKGIGYWWFKKGPWANGVDARTPDALELWKEIGLLGNEIKTARSLLVTSTPVDLPLATSTNVWARSLASGIDSMILIVVNDDYYNDLAGCHYTPVPGAMVTAILPSWLQSPTAFEISAAGLSDVNSVQKGNRLQLTLGTLKLTKMIILTTNPQLRVNTQQWYETAVRPGVQRMAPEVFAASR